MEKIEIFKTSKKSLYMYMILCNILITFSLIFFLSFRLLSISLTSTFAFQNLSQYIRGKGKPGGRGWSTKGRSLIYGRCSNKVF